ncbi:hypothetical protein AB3S75_010100 [Citrus x aurantiifolia]
MEHDKENVPPPLISSPVAVSAPAPSFKKSFKRRLRAPLADISNLFNSYSSVSVQTNSNQASDRNVCFLLPPSFSRKRKAADQEIGSTEGTCAKSLRMGFR